MRFWGIFADGHAPCKDCDALPAIRSGKRIRFAFRCWLSCRFFEPAEEFTFCHACKQKKCCQNSKNVLTKRKTLDIIHKLSDSTTEYGGIAQLGERLNGIQEVSGSIPLISTKESRNRKVSGLFSCLLWVLWGISSRFQNLPGLPHFLRTCNTYNSTYNGTEL